MEGGGWWDMERERMERREKREAEVVLLAFCCGGGIPESRRAFELSELLGVRIIPSQNELVVATGKGEPAVELSEYGFKKVILLEEYASCFDNIDPVSHFKSWTSQQANLHGSSRELVPSFDASSDRVKAAFVVSDPVDWGRDIQVLCDILRSGGLPGKKNGHQPDLYFAADDLEYQELGNITLCLIGEWPAKILKKERKLASHLEKGDEDLLWGLNLVQAVFPSERLGLGAFRTALESIFNRIHHCPLEYTTFGIPNPFVLKNAESILGKLRPHSCRGDLIMEAGNMTSHSFQTLYMIGDNPSVDIKGARQAGPPWFSILTRTGVFRGKENHAEFPADLIVSLRTGVPLPWLDPLAEHLLRRKALNQMLERVVDPDHVIKSV
ncbi:hypothetical protein RJ639_034665 [Escallonia herrerae]|uniref:Uncharacterized protein n=1 Tax=Escallonia herrerae TaxID=1293975 RepID=A0AA88WUK1_9ASTE|nr:hypothetical protein RJ639_034665 [Escallonia herrerae]